MDNLKFQKFAEINFSDHFFDSLKRDYAHGFIDWWNKKVKNTRLCICFIQ